MADADLSGAPWNGANGATPKRRFPIYIWGALSTLPKRKSLVKGLIDQTAMSVIFGASNSGKTFVAVDLGANVARGEVWRGRRVEQGAVVYIAAEGGLGIEERFAALARHRGINPGKTPLYVIPAAIDMCGSAADTTALISEIEAECSPASASSFSSSIPFLASCPVATRTARRTWARSSRIATGCAKPSGLTWR